MSRKQKPKPQPQPEPPRTESCFVCDGTGLICDVCGESEAACPCADEDDGPRPTYGGCKTCGGTGEVVRDARVGEADA